MATASWPKWQRNSILEAVEAGGLDLRECGFDFDTEVRITHAPSESSFVIANVGSHRTSTMSVGDLPSIPANHYTWPTIEARVERWAREVRRDGEMPDRWAELQRDRELLTGARQVDAESAPSPEEQAEIAGLLGEIKEYAVKTYALTETQTRILEARFDEIQEAAKYVRWKDLRVVVLGVMFELIVGDLLPPGWVQTMLGMALHGLEQILGGGDGWPELPALIAPPPTT